MSPNASKQRLQHDTPSASHSKPSSTCDGRSSQSAVALESPSAAQYRGHDIKTYDFTCDSDVDSDVVNDNNEASRDSGRHLGDYKRPRSTAPTPPSRGCERRRSCNSVGEDDEYEVEKILNVRVFYRRRLQYRVHWVGYKDDPNWYDASNFKNSPYKLREFHTAHPSQPGPPKRLRLWVQCWEEDKDADDHPDDNKPEVRGGDHEI